MPNPKIKHVQVDENTLADIDLPSTATPSITSLTTSGNVTVGGTISEGGTTLANKYSAKNHNHSGVYLPLSGGTLTGNLTLNNLNQNLNLSINGGLVVRTISAYGGDITLNDRLIVNNNSDLVGDVYVGEWIHNPTTGAVTPGTEGSLRVNGTIHTEGSINVEEGISTSDISVSGEANITGDVHCNNILAQSATFNGTVRANNDLKTSSVYPSESNKKSVGKSNYLYRHSYITEMHTDKITSLTNTETYTDPTTGEPATRNVFVTLPTASGTILTNNDIGTAASKAFTTSVTSGSSDLVTSGAVFTAIDNLPEPMVFKGTLGTGGTITSLPTAGATNEGFTYKVITAGTYASQVAKAGDVFVSNGSAWVIIPAGDTDSDTWRTIKVNGTQLLGSAISTGAVNLKSGSNVTITGSGNDIIIAAKDTTYSSKAAASGGTDVSLVTTGEKYIWNNKLDKSQVGYLDLNSSAPAGTLNDTQYAEVLKPYCLIFLGNFYYYKEADAGDLFWFNAVHFDSNNDIPYINSFKLTVTKATKRYEIVGGFNTTVQPKLVSGNSIKTINGESVLGHGNITIPTSPTVITEFLNTWSEKRDWTGLTDFSSINIWTDGDNIYYSSTSNHYVLDKSTSTWSQKTWTGLTSFNGQFIWTDGNNIYYSFNANQYVLDKLTSTWSQKTWTGLTNIIGANIWTDGNNIYYSDATDQYVLDKITSTWSTKTWTGLTSINGNNIWTDGDNIYYSSGINHYVLNKSTSTWSTKTWTGLTSLAGENVWTDGDNIYYSSTSNQYILDKSTSTWYQKTWTGLTSFYGYGVWTDGINIYYSLVTDQYVLDKSTHQAPVLAKVAETGSYNDLTNKPTIPTKISDLTNDSNFLVNNADISMADYAGTFKSLAVGNILIGQQAQIRGYSILANNQSTSFKIGAQTIGKEIRLELNSGSGPQLYYQNIRGKGLIIESNVEVTTTSTTNTRYKISADTLYLNNNPFLHAGAQTLTDTQKTQARTNIGASAEFDTNNKLNSDYINCGASSQKMYYQMTSNDERGPVRITDHNHYDNDPHYLVLMVSVYDINDGGSFGDMHIRGTVGGWVNRRYIDLLCSCRQGSFNEDSRLAGDYDGSVNILVAATGWDSDDEHEGYYGKMCIVLKLNGWYAYDLWLEGVQADILPYSTEHITRSQLNNLISSFIDMDGYTVCATSSTNSRGSLPLSS